MKKILFIIGSLGGGGAERIVTTIASYLSETNNYDVSILTYYSAKNEYQYSSKIKRINISQGDKEAYLNMSLIKKISQIRKKINLISPDEILCFLPHPLVLTYFALFFSKLRKRIIYAERANPKKDSSKIGKIKNIIVKKIKKIFTQNEGQKAFYNSICKTPVAVIPNPVYRELLMKEKKYSKVPRKVVSVGRLCDQKNFELGILAIYELRKQNIDVELYIYGNGNKKGKLLELTRKLCIERHIYFMGYEEDRSKIYGDKDIFLMTSKFEGMPNTLAEAMCYGVPVVSTNCEYGVSDLIFDEKMGVLLKDFEVGTVVKELKSIIINYKKYVDRAIIAKEVLANKFSYEKIMNLWHEQLK